jgi:hypothetical protein
VAVGVLFSTRLHFSFALRGKLGYNSGSTTNLASQRKDFHEKVSR